MVVGVRGLRHPRRLASNRRARVRGGPNIGRGGDERAGQTAEPTLEAHTPGLPEMTGRMLSVVAGERYATVEHSPIGGVLALPWAA